MVVYVAHTFTYTLYIMRVYLIKRALGVGWLATGDQHHGKQEAARRRHRVASGVAAGTDRQRRVQRDIVRFSPAADENNAHLFVYCTRYIPTRCVCVCMMLQTAVLLGSSCPSRKTYVPGSMYV